MKSFLSTLILASLSLAQIPCNPVPLYRKSATEPINGSIDRFDTTDMNEAHKSHGLDKQVASICSNQALGTVPLYRGFNPTNGLHMSTFNLNEEKFAGYQMERVIGYVYTQPPNGQSQFFKVFRFTIRGINIFTSNAESEGGRGGVKEDFFYSMPLAVGRPIYEYQKSCNPVPLFRKHTNELTYSESYPKFELGNVNSVTLTLTQPIYNKGFLDRIDTTDINEASKSHVLDRHIATICLSQANGTVPLYRFFNSVKGLHMSTIELNDKDPKFAGYQMERVIGYVYTHPPKGKTGFFPVFRIAFEETEHMTSEQRNEGNGNGITTELFYSMPKEDGKPLSEYPIKLVNQISPVKV